MENKLSLVNHLLQVVGERRVVSLETGHPSVLQAVQALDSYNRDFQAKGWWFNKLRGVELSQATNGEVSLPDDGLEFTIYDAQLAAANSRDKKRYSPRGNKVYDSWEHTFKINRSLKADLVILLNVEDLPQVAATYLKHYAAEQYYVDDDGDTTKADRLAVRTGIAFHNLFAAQMKAEATNAMDSPASVMMRYRIGQYGGGTNPNIIGG